MRFDTKQHPFDCGIDLPARSLDVCLLRQDGEVVLHRTMSASPEAVLKAIAPSRDHRVIAVAGLFPWSGLADRCAQAGRPWVRGHALSLQAIHGGKATHDTSDSQKSAVRLRGGMRPQASVSPAEMRAPRDRRRRRVPLTRQRAALLAHSQHTHSPSTLPESGKKLADKGHRADVAARCLAPAGQPRGAVARALRDHDERLHSHGALPSGQTATQHTAHALSRRQAVPGIGKSVRLVLRDAMHEITRFPRGQEVVSSGRVVTCAKEAAGKR